VDQVGRRVEGEDRMWQGLVNLKLELVDLKLELADLKLSPNRLWWKFYPSLVCRSRRQ
jgi:hypothetical protein